MFEDSTINSESIEGSVTVTVERQFPSDLGGLTGVGVLVVIDEVGFPAGSDSVSLAGMTIDTQIGWLPG